MATEHDPEAARSLFRQGVQQYEAGELDAARRSFEESLRLEPGRAATAVRLAGVRLKQGAPEEALGLVHGVLDADPGHADALGLRGTAFAMLGFFPNALQAFDQLVELQPRNAQAWTLRGNVLREMGRYEEAEASFGKAVQDSPAPEVMAYFAAASGRDAPPDSAPRDYVQSLFDNYASNYDTELVDTLNYRVPELLAQGLQRLGRRYSQGIDLGCGTGLCAPLVKPFVDRLDGVDLSPQMLEHAKARGLYESLHAGDIVEFLAAASTPWDLAVAGDVFLYVGRLEPVFAQLQRLMPAGGVLCFSVEAHDGPEPLVLQHTRRYAHSQPYVEGLAAGHGLRMLQLERAAIREQRGVPVQGFCVWLERDG
ncbi:tetratricopeptide repeat protein [Ramlibacter albus]|uniref:Tetratricopeptide repeat protein n=1 Tax=Ramlibacter albus TaxID=2079448 RepID=A0A923M800_9BURK|nr:tetratricopeptide repeat protein [Ramlibacter albus]MBC5765070.1 tetratricopeptide repeat protein [Ramlibacter albus]